MLPTGVLMVALAPGLLLLPLTPLAAALADEYSPWYDCVGRDVELARTMVAVVGGHGNKLRLRRGRLRGKRRVYGKTAVEGRIAEAAGSWLCSFFFWPVVCGGTVLRKSTGEQRRDFRCG